MALRMRASPADLREIYSAHRSGVWSWRYRLWSHSICATVPRPLTCPVFLCCSSAVVSFPGHSHCCWPFRRDRQRPETRFAAFFLCLTLCTIAATAVLLALVTGFSMPAGMRRSAQAPGLTNSRSPRRAPSISSSSWASVSTYRLDLPLSLWPACR